MRRAGLTSLTSPARPPAPARPGRRFIRRHRRLRAGLTQLLFMAAGLVAGIFVPKITVSPMLSSGRIVDLLFAAGVTVISLVTVSAIDSLEGLLGPLAGRDGPIGQLADRDGVIRVVLHLPRWDDFARSSLDDVIAAAAASPMVLLRLRACCSGSVRPSAPAATFSPPGNGGSRTRWPATSQSSGQIPQSRLLHPMGEPHYAAERIRTRNSVPRSDRADGGRVESSVAPATPGGRRFPERAVHRA